MALCRLYAERERLDADRVYEDRARSGGSIIGRDGLSALLDDARNGLFQVLIVEALDRLSRDMEDLAGLHKRLTFLDIEIRAVHEGQVNTALVGLRGLIGQLYREDNAHKVRRGLAGCIREGRSAGGLAYGYRAVPSEPGKYAILEEEAAVVRRIFTEYLDGNRPRAIAAGLNEDCIPPPRGKRWNGSTINGNTKRGNGILHNEIYVGRLVWNKVRMVKDPATGRRVSRENPASEHRVAESPELRIVEPDLFKAAQDLKRSRGGLKPHTQRRSKHLLSGLLRCGSCGSGMSSAGSDRQGVRVRCSRAKESGDCPDPKTFYLATIEAAVLSGLREELRKPAVITEYVREYHAERQRLAASANEVRARTREAPCGDRSGGRTLHRPPSERNRRRSTHWGALQGASHRRGESTSRTREGSSSPKRCQPAPCRSGTLRNPNCEPADGSFGGACCRRFESYRSPAGTRGQRRRVQRPKSCRWSDRRNHRPPERIAWRKGLAERCSVVRGIDGSGGGTRTPDTRIMIPLL